MKTDSLETGCYLDSHQGHYIVRDMIEMAHNFGYIIDPFEQFALDQYEDHNHDENYPHECLYELSDNAINWLNSSPTEREIPGQNMPPARPVNTCWEWNDGDFGLYEWSNDDQVA